MHCRTFYHQWNIYLALILLFVFGMVVDGLAQSSIDKHQTAAEHEAHHRLTVGLGHTQLANGTIGAESRWRALASWTLNYDYKFSRRWAVGLQNDVVLENYVIESYDKELIEREYPITVVPVALFKATQNIFLIGGAGVEHSAGHSLGLTRLGLEYGFEFNHEWEFGVAAVWDNKWNYYNSWGLTLTASRIWH